MSGALARAKVAHAVKNIITRIWDDLDDTGGGVVVPGTGCFQSFPVGAGPYDGYPGACFVAQWQGMYHFLAGQELRSDSTTGIENALVDDGL